MIAVQVLFCLHLPSPAFTSLHPDKPVISRCFKKRWRVKATFSFFFKKEWNPLEVNDPFTTGNRAACQKRIFMQNGIVYTAACNKEFFCRWCYPIFAPQLGKTCALVREIVFPNEATRKGVFEALHKYTVQVMEWCLPHRKVILQQILPLSLLLQRREKGRASQSPKGRS